jgi:hypothetical protein
MEFGIFNSEGCIESGLWSRAEAEARMTEAYSEETDVRVAVICTDHEEEESGRCEKCDAEESAEE